MSRLHLGVVIAFLISGVLGLFILPQEIETTRWIIIDSAPKQAWQRPEPQARRVFQNLRL